MEPADLSVGKRRDDFISHLKYNQQSHAYGPSAHPQRACGESLAQNFLRAFGRPIFLRVPVTGTGPSGLISATVTSEKDNFRKTCTASVTSEKHRKKLRRRKTSETSEKDAVYELRGEFTRGL